MSDPIETTDMTNEGYRTYEPGPGDFKNGCEQFNALSPMPEKPISLGDGRFLHIQSWAVSQKTDDHTYVVVEGFIAKEKVK